MLISLLRSLLCLTMCHCCVVYGAFFDVFVVFSLKMNDQNLKFYILRFMYYSGLPYGAILKPMHCTENPIYVFPDMKLRSLVPTSYISVSVSGLNITRIGLPIWLQRNWKLGDRSL
jgi:hypothetical protein